MISVPICNCLFLGRLSRDRHVPRSKFVQPEDVNPDAGGQRALLPSRQGHHPWPTVLTEHLPREQGAGLDAGLRAHHPQPSVLRPGDRKGAEPRDDVLQPGQDQGGGRIQLRDTHLSPLHRETSV